MMTNVSTTFVELRDLEYLVKSESAQIQRSFFIKKQATNLRSNIINQKIASRL